MMHFSPLARKFSLAALLAATAIPTSAYAGDHTNAIAAIAEAKGKIDAGDKVGVGVEAPELQAQARAAIGSADDLLARGKKREAIAAAHHAGELADQALVSADARKATAERMRRLDAQDAAIAAQQSAANANMRADSAQQSATNANVRADNAQAATAVANRRADSAVQAGAEANAQADALRNLPPPAAAPSTTTVAVTEHRTVMAPVPPSHHTRKRTGRTHARSGHAKTTTTVVTTTHR